MVRSSSHGLGQSDPSENLFGLLRDQARERSLAYLVVEAALSTAAALSIVSQRPYWWALYLPPAIIACYSLWGLLDRATGMTRATSDSNRRTRVIHGVILGVDWILVAAGTLGALMLFFLITGYLLGRWIH
ncbi:MAG: hypothetical protein ACR2M1_03410 [Gemmatimonadaceae bacterium]